MLSSFSMFPGLCVSVAPSPLSPAEGSALSLSYVFPAPSWEVRGPWAPPTAENPAGDKLLISCVYVLVMMGGGNQAGSHVQSAEDGYTTASSARCRFMDSVISLCPHMARGQVALVSSGHQSCHGVPTLKTSPKPNQLLTTQSPTSNTITSEVRPSTYEFEEMQTFHT